MKAPVLHIDLVGAKSRVLHLGRKRMRDRIAENPEANRRIDIARGLAPIFQISERVTRSVLFLLHAITTTRARSLACGLESCRSVRSSVASRDYNADYERHFSSFGLYPRHCGGGCSGKEIRTNSDAFSTRAERLSPHRPREVDLPEFRHRTRVRWYLQCADGRYEPDERRDRVRQFHHGRRALADQRLGGQTYWRRTALRLRLFRQV